MEQDKKNTWIGTLIVVIVILLLILSIQKSRCKYSDDGYLKVYEWIDGWSKNCQSENKIFTVESDENGTIINPRCAIEQKDGSMVFP